MFNHFCFKKLLYCQYIFVIACIQPCVVPKLFLFFDNLNITALTECTFTEKSV